MYEQVAAAAVMYSIARWCKGLAPRECQFKIEHDPLISGGVWRVTLRMTDTGGGPPYLVSAEHIDLSTACLDCWSDMKAHLINGS
jgi:hypothetical protein